MPGSGILTGFGTRLRHGVLQGQRDENLYRYTTPGNFLWTPPRGVSAVRVIRVSGGAGGGAGRYDTTTATVRGGGGGGASSALGDLTIEMTQELFAPWAMTIGAGGAGGAAQTSNSTNGSNGGAPTLTSIRVPGKPELGLWSLVCLSVATAGGGGTAGAGTGGTAGVGHISGTPGNASSATGAAPATNTTTRQVPTGGGGGGGITTADVASIGGAPLTHLQTSTGFSSGTPAGGAVDNAGSDGVPVYGWLAFGASGGGASATGAGGSGGNGLWGSGGGGGGASSAAASQSGAGGRGGDGFVLLFMIW